MLRVTGGHKQAFEGLGKRALDGETRLAVIDGRNTGIKTEVSVEMPWSRVEETIMKIVVIGGTGLIGSKLVNKLREHGHEAVAASPNSGVNTANRAV